MKQQPNKKADPSHMEDFFLVASPEAALTPEDVYPTPLYVDDTSSDEWKCKRCPDRPDMVLQQPEAAGIYKCPGCGWIDF